MPSFYEEAQKGLGRIVSESLQTNTNPYLKQLHADDVVIDGDTISGYRPVGYDTLESTAGVSSNEKARKLEAAGISLATQKKLGLAGKDKLKEWVASNPNAIFERKGYDAFGRGLLNNEELTTYMIQSGTAVPTDRYDEKRQSVYRATQEKLQKIGPEAARAMEIQREYNIARQKPGFIERVGDAVDAFQSGTQQALAGTADFVLDVVTPGDNTLLNKAKSTEYANEVWGYDNRESNFTKQEALHKFKNKEYVGAVMEMATSPELWGESLPMIAEMAVGAGKFTALGKLMKAGTQGLKGAEKVAEAKLIRDGATAMEKATLLGAENAGFLGVVGDQTNRHIEEFTANNNGVGPSMSQIAGMTAMNVLQLGLDRFAFNQLISTKGGINTLKETVAPLLKVVPESTLGEIAKKVATSATGVTAAMGTEAGQEYLQTWAELLNTRAGTSKYGDWIYVLQNPEAQDEAIIGALAGSGMGGQMRGLNEVVQVTPTLLQAGNTAIDKMRTINPSMSQADKTAVNLVGGEVDTTPRMGTSFRDSVKDYTISIDTAVKAGDVTTANETLSAMKEQFKERFKEELGADGDRSAEYIDGMNHLLTMVNKVKSALPSDTKNIQAVAREYKNYEATKGSQDIPTELGAKREAGRKQLESMIDLGVLLDDVSMKDLDATAEFYGIDAAKVEQYKTERNAIKEVVDTLKAETIKGGKKSAAQVEYEATIGPAGWLRSYEKMKAADSIGDTDSYNQARTKLETFMHTQVSKIDKLQKAVDAHGDVTTEVVYGGNGEKFVLEAGAKGTNSANKVIRLAQTTVDGISKVLGTTKPEQKEASVAPNGEVVAKDTTQSKVEETLVKVKPSETRKEVAKPKVKAPAKPTAEKVEATVTEPKVGTATEVLPQEESTKEESKTRRSIDNFKETLKILKVKAKSVFGEGVKEKEKAYIEDLGEVVGNEVVLNDDVLEAMGKAYIQWLATDAKSTMNTTGDMMSKMVGINKKLPGDIIAKLEGKGVLRKNVVDTLGQMVLDQIEVNVNKDMPWHVLSNIKAGLGNAVLLTLMNKKFQDEPLIIESTISKEEWGSITGTTPPQDVVMVQFNPKLGKFIKLAKKMVKEDPEFAGIESLLREPSYGKTTINDKHEFRKRPNANISSKDEARLSAQEKIRHSVKTNVYSALNRLGEYAKVAAGWESTKGRETELHKTTMASIEALNRAIETSLENLHEHVEKANDSWYTFKYFMSGNGRDMIDSNLFNPQSNKIHRHMDYTGKPIDPRSNTEHMEYFKLAVLQGLDYGVDKMSQVSVQVAWEEILSDEKIMEYAELLSKDTELSESQQKEIAEYLASKANIHTLDALVALGEYARAEKSGGEFKTTLQLEVDAVTSGWILALLQNPAFDMETNKAYLAKGGVYINNPDMVYQDVAESKSILDSYETVAAEVNNYLVGVPDTVLEVMKVDRNFAKMPFMTHIVYGAGINGVKEDIVNTFIQKLYDKMVKDPKAVVKLVKQITGRDIEVWNQHTYEFDKKTKEAIAAYINSTYGEAVETALKTKYSAFTEVRNVLNNAFKEMFTRYSEEYKKAYATLEKNGTISKADIKAMERDLAKYIPTIKSPNGSDVQIFKKEKMDAINRDLLTVQTQLLTGDKKSITTTLEQKRMAASDAAGGVVPIHFIDGAVIGELLKSFVMTGVYDAGMFSLDDVKAATEMYNEKLIEISKNYNLLGEVIKSAKASGTVTAKTMEALIDAEKVASKNREEIFNSNLNVQHFAMNGIRWSNDNPTNILESMVDDKKTLDVIMSVLKEFKDCK